MRSCELPVFRVRGQQSVYKHKSWWSNKDGQVVKADAGHLTRAAAAMRTLAQLSQGQGSPASAGVSFMLHLPASLLATFRQPPLSRGASIAAPQALKRIPQKLPTAATHCLRIADTRVVHGQSESRLVKQTRSLFALVTGTSRGRLREEGHDERAPLASPRGLDFGSSFGSGSSSSSSSSANHALSVTFESGQSNALFGLVPEYKEMDCR